MPTPDLYDIIDGGTIDQLREALAQSDIDLEQRTDSGSTPLMMAIEHSEFELAQALIEAGADVNATNKNGRSVLHCAVSAKHDLLTHLLINAGANVNVANNLGITPLHIAACSYHQDITELLIAHQADPNATDHLGETPLHRAIMVRDIAAVKLLISANANVNAQDNKGLTPYDNARDPDIKATLEATGQIDPYTIERRAALKQFTGDGHAQQRLIQCMQAWGLDTDEKGVCFGVANMAVLARLPGGEGQDRFNQRLIYMGKLLNEAADYARLLYFHENDKDYNSNLREVLAVLIQENTNAVRDKVKANVQAKKPWDDGLSEDERVILDIPAFLEGIELFQSGYKKHQDYLPEKTDNKQYWQSEAVSNVSDVLSPKQLKAQGVNNAGITSGIYTLEELKIYFKEMSEALSDSTEPIAIRISNQGHAITVTFDPTQTPPSWSFIDANNLPPIVTTDSNHIATNVFHGLTKQGNIYVTMSSHIYTSSQNEKRVIEKLSMLKQSPTWQRIHDHASKASLRSEKYNHTWLRVAAGAGDIDAINAFITAGVELNDDFGNCRTLEYASRAGHNDIVNALIAAGARDDNNHALEEAIEYGHTDIIDTLLKINKHKNLQAAIKGKSVVTAKALMQREKSKNAQRKKASRFTQVLMRLGLRKNDPRIALHTALSTNNPDMIDLVANSYGDELQKTAPKALKRARQRAEALKTVGATRNAAAPQTNPSTNPPAQSNIRERMLKIRAQRQAQRKHLDSAFTILAENLPPGTVQPDMSIDNARKLLVNMPDDSFIICRDPDSSSSLRIVGLLHDSRYSPRHDYDFESTPTLASVLDSFASHYGNVETLRSQVAPKLVSHTSSKPSPATTAPAAYATPVTPQPPATDPNQARDALLADLQQVGHNVQPSASRNEAEAQLANQPPGSYILRESSRPGCIAVTFVDSDATVRNALYEPSPDPSSNNTLDQYVSSIPPADSKARPTLARALDINKENKENYERQISQQQNQLLTALAKRNDNIKPDTSSQDAAALLVGKPPGSFIMRKSSHPGCIVVTYVNQTGVAEHSLYRPSRNPNSNDPLDQFISDQPDPLGNHVTLREGINRHQSELKEHQQSHVKKRAHVEIHTAPSAKNVKATLITSPQPARTQAKAAKRINTATLMTQLTGNQTDAQSALQRSQSQEATEPLPPTPQSNASSEIIYERIPTFESAWPELDKALESVGPRKKEAILGIRNKLVELGVDDNKVSDYCCALKDKDTMAIMRIKVNLFGMDSTQASTLIDQTLGAEQNQMASPRRP